MNGTCACGKPAAWHLFLEGEPACARCYDKAAPLGWIVCGLCGYEKAKGLPCGEPCV